MLFLVFLISTIVKCDRLRKVITLHHANLLSKHSKPRRHPSPIRRKGLCHLIICSFRVSSCDKKNLKRIFIPYNVLWKELCVLYPWAPGELCVLYPWAPGELCVLHPWASGELCYIPEPPASCVISLSHRRVVCFISLSL